MLQSHTTPSYLWNEDYSAHPNPTEGDPKAYIDPFTPVENPETKLNIKKRQSSPPNTVRSGSRASPMQQPRGSKDSSGDNNSKSKILIFILKEPKVAMKIFLAEFNL